MPFNLPEYNNKTFEKTSFLRLDPGSHTVRFLDAPEKALTVMTHFVMGKFTIVCPDEGCPICENNKQIRFEFPDTFRDQKGYSPRVTNFLVNVLDRTVGKICPSCGIEVKPGGVKNSFPPACPGCNTFLHDVKPMALNAVKVLKFGVQLATALNTIERATCGTDGEPLGLNNFDLVLSVEGTKQKKVVTPIPTTHVDKVNVPEEMLQNLENAMIKLSSDEITELLKGVSLSDIYKARRVTQKIAEVKARVEEDTTDDGTPPFDVDMEDIQQGIKGILK